MKAPNCLDFTPEEIDALLIRLDGECLQRGDYSLLADILKAMVWLSLSLQEKELSIMRLRKIFGIKTESAKKLLALAHGKSSGQGNNDENHSEKNDKTKEEKQEKKKPKNHGHRPSTDYSQAKVIEVASQTLKKGDKCPDCLKGKLFQLKPGTVIHIVGQPWLQIEIYRPERLRCSTCGKIFTASLPSKVVSGSRADSSAKTIVSLLKYRGGVPFYRQGQIQDILGAPISASEIWEMTEQVADALQPVYASLCLEAANAKLIHNDDTSAKILSRMKELKMAEKEPERSGTFTSCIVGVLEVIDKKAALFFTGWKHAGENLDELLEKRSEDLSPPIQECDALSRNVPKNHETKLANCIAHLRRKFYELVDVWPKEVVKIIGEFSLLFANEHEAPEDPEERLKWHQKESGPIMERLKNFCNSLIEEKKVEPNSSLGKAIAYMNNHWEAFTLFLKIAQVPLTNNDGERLIKRAVLNRKNAYFFRNETGAKIADILMSVIETCVLNDINPYNFLVAVQQHAADVRKNPKLWLPWLYEDRLKELAKV
ncbi:MAG: IS66 family transposase [Waddliaceae bacterium]